MVKRFSASRLTRVLYDRSIDVFSQFFAFIFFLSTRSKGWKNKNKETPVTAFNSCFESSKHSVYSRRTIT